MSSKRLTDGPSPASSEATPFDDGALHDLVFERLDLGLDFYLRLAKAAGGPVLDVACGTGRIMLPCLKAGVDVEGLDLFPSMLARLRHKAAALGFEPPLHQANMAGFRLLRLAGFARWEILGGFDGRPLERETDAMIVQACTAVGAMKIT